MEGGTTGLAIEIGGAQMAVLYATIERRWGIMNVNAVRKGHFTRSQKTREGCSRVIFGV